jgi:type II secretory pathway component PulL
MNWSGLMTEKTMIPDAKEAEYVVMDELADQYVELARAIGMDGHEEHDVIMIQARMLYECWLSVYKNV